MSDFVYTLKAAVIYLFVLFFSAGSLTIVTGRPSGNLVFDLIFWAAGLTGFLYAAMRLAVFLRRRRFGDAPPSDPPLTRDLMVYGAMFLFGPVLIAMFAHMASQPGKDRNFAIGAIVVGVFMMLSPLAVFRAYVTRK